MGIAELKADVKVHRDRILAMDLTKLDAKKLGELVKFELTENVLPLLEGMLDTVQADVVDHITELDVAVDELMDQSEEILHPETSAQIVGVLELGKLLAAELDALCSMVADDMRRKKIKTKIAAYRQGAEVVIAAVQDLTLDGDEADDDEEERPKPGSAAASAPAPEDEDDDEVTDDPDEPYDDGEDDDGEDE